MQAASRRQQQPRPRRSPPRGAAAVAVAAVAAPAAPTAAAAAADAVQACRICWQEEGKLVVKLSPVPMEGHISGGARNAAGNPPQPPHPHSTCCRW
jgi:hypothetical protein